MVQPAGRSSYERIEGRLPLPPFVQPFLPTLALFTDNRNKAVKEKDETSLGVLVLFIIVTAKSPTSEWPAETHIRLLASLLELELAELVQCAQVVEENLDGLDPLLKSAFRQLEASGLRRVLLSSPFPDPFFSDPLHSFPSSASPILTFPSTVPLNRRFTELWKQQRRP
jgi:hypothetical protein